MKHIFEQSGNQKKRTWILSILSAALMALLIVLVYQFSAPNPNMILITALVLFTGIGGLIPGAISAVLMALYSLFFFSIDHSFFRYTEENGKKIVISLLGIVACYLIVGFLKRNRDRNHKALVTSNQELLSSNEMLEQKAKEAALFVELSDSVNSLLDNMPALTFSKDIATGKYMACNQLFAEYAHKETPEGVVGLTDHDIFDPVTADHFVEDDRIALSREEPYIFFEDVPDAAGFPRHFQTTKQKFIDRQGRLCTLGMCVDVTELVNMKQETQEIRDAFEQSRYERLMYGQIAGTLSADYTYVYYVNLETEEYVEFRESEQTGQLTEADRGLHFFESARQEAETNVYGPDVSEFRKNMSRRHMEEVLSAHNSFQMIYRMQNDGKPEYVSLKASRSRENPKYLVIGVMNIDEQMKEKEALTRSREERTAYTRINALSQDYIVIYSVDPETLRYKEYSVTSGYQNLNLPSEGEQFFDLLRNLAKENVHPEDRGRFESMFTEENVMREIRTNGIFALKYRLLMNRVPVFVRLKAALVEEQEGTRLIVGIINISEQVKQDQEYEYHLSIARTMAHKDGLTGVRNMHAYAEMERELNHQIDGFEKVEFAVVVFDVNGLKTVNDTRGHQAGDEWIKSASSLICNTFKHSPVFRIGGDEFAVIARGQDYENAEQLMQEIARQNQEHMRDGNVVIAGGLACYNGERSVAAVFEKADQRMYENKRALKL